MGCHLQRMRQPQRMYAKDLEQKAGSLVFLDLWTSVVAAAGPS